MALERLRPVAVAAHLTRPAGSLLRAALGDQFQSSVRFGPAVKRVYITGRPAARYASISEPITATVSLAAGTS